MTLWPPMSNRPRRMPGAMAEAGLTRNFGLFMVPRRAKVRPKTPCPLPPVRSWPSRGTWPMAALRA